MAQRRSTHTVRIIAGQWRSRRLAVADLPGLRPSGDRVRETLFNWLAAYLPGARVLDAYAGSGALGFEALSRGARHAVLVDNQRECVATLQDNVALLGADASVIKSDVRRWLGTAPASAPFDIVFVDPPFDAGGIAELCTLLIARDWLAPAGLVYVEQPITAQLELPQALQLMKSQRAGNVSFSLYALKEED